METQTSRPNPWKLRIALGLLILLGLGVQAAVTLALRHNIKFFVPGRHELLEAATFALWSSQFAAALFCMTYSRFAAPWRHLWCTFWAVSAATLFELRVPLTQIEVVWELVGAVISLWSGYAVFVLGRWHFGTEFALGEAAPSKRQWFLSIPVISRWLVILSPALVGNIILTQLPPTESNELVGLFWSGAFAWAVIHALFYFPLLSAMLMRRFTWILFAGIAIIFVGMVIYDISLVIFVNPPFALQKLQTALISITPPLCIAFTFRFVGLRWQEAEPWPSVARPVMKTVPNPFE